MPDGQSPPSPAEARHVPILPLDEVMQRFADAGVGRSRRSLIRYCQNGLLDCTKGDTTTGPTWFATEDSVSRAIQQIKDMIALTDAARHSTLEPARARNGGVGITLPIEHGGARHTPPVADSVVRVQSEEASLAEPATARYVAQLEKRIEEKDQVISLITTQLTAKDQQISELSTRYRETHTLLGAMQRMLAPLLGQPDPYHAAPEVRDTSAVPHQSG